MIISRKPPYASSQTDPEQTQMNINKLLRGYGVSGLQWTTLFDQNKVELSFLVEAEINGVKKEIGINVTPPVFAAPRRTWNSKSGRYEKVYAPNWAQSFRLLYWWLKAKLEAVAYGLTSVEQEFLSQVIVSLPTGQQTTIGVALTNTLQQGQLALEAKPEEAENRVIEVEAEQNGIHSS
jgi:hypothetical protein